MRTYPRSHYLYDLCQYLLARPRDFFKSSFASLDFPGMFTMTEEIKTFGKYKRPGYSGKVIILVNEFTQSEAEFNTMAFQCIPGAIVIGRQTAGADEIGRATSELQSLMRISYAVLCFKKKNKH